MQRNKKIIIAVVSILAAVAVLLAVRWVFRYYLFNDYKEDLSGYEYEDGTTFLALDEEKSDVEGMVLAAENDNLKLYANLTSGEIAIVDKRNGSITYSNPGNVEDDSIATETNKNYLRSQLVVDYYNAASAKGIMDSYSYSVARDQLEAEGIEEGIRFIYTIGDMSSKTGIVPQYISEQALTEILDALSAEGKKFVSQKYKESDVAEGYYELLESAQKGSSQLRKLNTYFEEAGFTVEDYAREMANSGVEDAVPSSFIIPLEYRLIKDAVEVSIPMSGVQENGGAKIYDIQLLRYFGAAGTNEEGYMLVPNGSGSLIYFNNGKSAATPYSEFVYGMDTLAAGYTVTENTQNVKLSLFGIFRENNALFATIEDGAALTNLNAYVSGKINDYNFVYPTFVLRESESLSMFGSTGNEADLPIVENEYYDSKLTVRYTFLTEQDASYSGAANYYRNRLEEEGVLKTQKEENSSLKFYYDILGGVEMTKFFLGIRYDGMYTMTTFDEAGEIYDDLLENGIDNQVMNFMGWMNGGYYHDVADRIKIPGALGNKSDLEALSQRMEKQGSSFYADVAFQRVAYKSKRYSVTNETSRYYGSGYVAEFGLVDPTSLRRTADLGYPKNLYYLVSPKFLVRYVDAFAKKSQAYEIMGISLRDLGDELHSDKKRTNVIDREEALDVVTAALEQLDGTGKNMLVSGGNDYTFAYAEDIINAPISANDYYIIDETIPFYEMLIHGYIDYSGSLINLSDTYDKTDVVLNLIENGASPHFVFSKENSSEIKNTSLNRFYSTAYKNWKEDALSIYNKTNGALQYVTDARIVEHEIINKDLRKVTYSNDVTIYVNYGTTPQTIDGVDVSAKGYAIGGIAR